MEQIIIKAENVKAAWGEHLTENGFEKEGRFFDKYGKKYDCWSKEGSWFTARASRNNENDLVISLTDVTDKDLRDKPFKR